MSTAEELRRIRASHQDSEADRLRAENENLRHVLSPLTGVLDALNEGTTPRPSMSLRRSLVEQARAVLHSDA